MALFATKMQVCDLIFYHHMQPYKTVMQKEKQEPCRGRDTEKAAAASLDFWQALLVQSAGGVFAAMPQ